MIKYEHKNLFIMIPYEEREKVAGYFDLDVVGEEYAKLLGDLTDDLSKYAVKDDDLGENTVITPILRAGQSMSNRLTKRMPKAEVAKISMRRNIKTLKPFVAWDEYDKISDIQSKKLIITDPALATGGSILKTIEYAIQNGFNMQDIIIMSMFGCVSGIETIFAAYPEVRIYLVHLADGIREDGYLLPYNGDTGDRLYGVRENEFVLE